MFDERVIDYGSVPDDERVIDDKFVINVPWNFRSSVGQPCCRAMTYAMVWLPL